MLISRLMRYLRAAFLALFVAHVIACLALDHAEARSTIVAGQLVPNNIPFLTPTVDISAGQSWRVNYFLGFNVNFYSLNPQTQTLLTLRTFLPSAYPSGLLSLSAGISLPNPGNFGGLGGMTSAMSDSYPPPAVTTDTGNALDIGRAAALAEQLLRVATGLKPLVPIINYNMACPASSWITGPCGGLGNQSAIFTGTISGAPSSPVLTISAVTGTVTPGQIIIGSFDASSSPNILGTGISPACAALTTCGNGTYNIANVTLGQPVNGTGTWTAESYPWFSASRINASIQSTLPSNEFRLNAPSFRSVGWTQGGSFNNTTSAPTVAEWTAMEAAYDGLGLPGSGLTFFIGIRTAQGQENSDTQAEVGAWQFVRTNANGRTVGTQPMYPYPFDGTDTIHVGPYGDVRMGEFEGYQRFVRYSEGVLHPTPLWSSRTNPIVVDTVAQTVTIPFDRPTGSAFASSILQFIATATDGVISWPQKGFDLKDNTVTCAVIPTISGLNVVLTVTSGCTLAGGDTLEISYAFYGPGAGGFIRSGVGGNLAMAGPESVLFPGQSPPLPIYSWAWPFDETVTVP